MYRNTYAKSPRELIERMWCKVCLAQSLIVAQSLIDACIYHIETLDMAQSRNKRKMKRMEK